MAIGIQEADVIRAADELLQQGEQPTVERVRQRLGRGSPNTVGPHLKRWFATLGPRMQGLTQLPGPILALAEGFWGQSVAIAREEIDRRLQQSWADVEKARQEVISDRAAVDAERQRLAQRETDLLTAAAQSREQAQAAERRLAAAEERLATRSRELATVTADMTAKLDTAQSQATAFADQLRQQERAHQTAIQEAQTRHDAHERRWLGEIDALRQAVKQAEETLVAQRKETKQAAERSAQKIQELESDLRRLQNASDDMGREHESLKAHSEALAQSNETLTQRLAGIQQDMASSRAEWMDRLRETSAHGETLRQQLELKDKQLETMAALIDVSKQPKKRR